MKQPTFPRAVLAALCIAAATGAAFAALAPAAGAEGALRLVMPAASLAWLLWLLRRGSAPAGRIAVLALWSAASAATWLLAPPIATCALIHAGLLWLARSLCLDAGLFPALLDAALSALSLSAAGWALSRSGSVFLAAWSFFLLQALFVFIPPAPGRRRAADPDEDGYEAFESARRRADAALRQLLSH